MSLFVREQPEVALHAQFYWGNIIDIKSLIKAFCINTAHTRSLTLYNVELLTIKLIMYGSLNAKESDKENRLLSCDVTIKVFMIKLDYSFKANKKTKCLQDSSTNWIM